MTSLQRELPHQASSRTAIGSWEIYILRDPNSTFSDHTFKLQLHVQHVTSRVGVYDALDPFDMLITEMWIAGDSRVLWRNMVRKVN